MAALWTDGKVRFWQVAAPAPPAPPALLTRMPARALCLPDHAHMARMTQERSGTWQPLHAVGLDVAVGSGGNFQGSCHLQYRQVRRAAGCKLRRDSVFYSRPIGEPLTRRVPLDRPVPAA